MHEMQTTIFFFFHFHFPKVYAIFSDALTLSQPSSITYRFNAIYLYLMVIVSFPMRTQLILINWLKGKLWAFVFDFSFSCISIRFGFSCQKSDFFFLIDFHIVFHYSLLFLFSCVFFQVFSFDEWILDQKMLRIFIVFSLFLFWK